MDFNCDVQNITHRPKSEIVPDILLNNLLATANYEAFNTFYTQELRDSFKKDTAKNNCNFRKNVTLPKLKKMTKDGFTLRNDKRVNLFFCSGEADSTIKVIRLLCMSTKMICHKEYIFTKIMAGFCL